VAEHQRVTAPWWRAGAVYHVYPRSFADASGDGVGDLPGITAHLDHLAWLGVDAAWLSPVYRSPMRDAGYDIADHRAVDPLFGTLADLDALLAGAHARGLRVLLDYVPNHTSDQHPWFREHPERYLWHPGPAPNNWRSVFGGSAWRWVPERGASYYHAYLPEQPDLDWRDPAVRKDMLGVLRFWCERGVDGFRIDALRQLVKDPLLRDNPPNPDWRPGMREYDALLPVHTTDREEIHALTTLMREAVGDRLLVGELYLPLERLVRYHPAIDLPSNMHLTATPWEAEAIAALVERYEALLPDDAWPNWVLGNHDQPRVASRVGPAQARVAAMLLLTLRGTPTLYGGDELGLPDGPDLGLDPAGRDPARAPMPWEDGPGGGFCPPGVEPWLPVDASTSVAAQRADPRSALALHRALLALRRAFALEPYATVRAGDGVLAYRRGARTLVALNLTAEPRRVGGVRGEIALSTHLDRRERVAGELALRRDEGVVLTTG